jgi:ABC-type lipoprotein export system ATPase subunit
MITLKQVKPMPLIENGLNTHSNIFNTEGVFQKGKKYLVTAPSGKGKSTFLHLIYGLRNDYEGDIFFKEKNIKQYSPDAWADLRQKQFAIVFQDLRLFLNMTGLENIKIKQDLTSTPSPQEAGSRSSTVSEVEKWVERLGLAKVIHQKCETMSYGQRQRVAIIRALCQPFDFLFLDEPFSHLDTENIKIASDLILERCKLYDAGLIMVSLGDTYFFDYDERYVV